jgi:hypothetical protein
MTENQQPDINKVPEVIKRPKGRPRLNRPKVIKPNSDMVKGIQYDFRKYVKQMMIEHPDLDKFSYTSRMKIISDMYKKYKKENKV